MASRRGGVIEVCQCQLDATRVNAYWRQCNSSTSDHHRHHRSLYPALANRHWWLLLLLLAVPADAAPPASVLWRDRIINISWSQQFACRIDGLTSRPCRHYKVIYIIATGYQTASPQHALNGKHEIHNASNMKAKRRQDARKHLTSNNFNNINKQQNKYDYSNKVWDFVKNFKIKIWRQYLLDNFLTMANTVNMYFYHLSSKNTWILWPTKLSYVVVVSGMQL